MRNALKKSLVLLTVSFVVPIMSVQGQGATRVQTAASQNTAPPEFPSEAERPVTIHVDLTKTVGSYTPIYSWFGYDESNYTTMKYGKQLLRELHDLSPVPVYIRAHHLLTSGNGVAELKWSSIERIQPGPERQAGVRLHDYRRDVKRLPKITVLEAIASRVIGYISSAKSSSTFFRCSCACLNSGAVQRFRARCRAASFMWMAR